MKKGFSLFTPLVGTAMILIAILISAIMIQSDVRISKGMTKGLDVSRGSNAARLAEASITAGILRGFHEYIYDEFSGMRITCGILTDCDNEIGKRIEDIERDLTERVYDNVIPTKIREAVASTGFGIPDDSSYECPLYSECDGSLGYDKFKCCFSRALLAQGVSMASSGTTGAQEISATIEPPLQSDPNYAQINSLLTIPLRSKDGLTVSSRVLPMKLTYVSPDPLVSYLDWAKEGYRDSIIGMRLQAVGIGDEIEDVWRKLAATDVTGMSSSHLQEDEWQCKELAKKFGAEIKDEFGSALEGVSIYCVRRNDPDEIGFVNDAKWCAFRPKTLACIREIIGGTFTEAGMIKDDTCYPYAGIAAKAMVRAVTGDPIEITFRTSDGADDNPADCACAYDSENNDFTCG